MLFGYTAKTLYRKFETDIPRNETVRPSQFLHLCICERLIYSIPMIGPGKIGEAIVGMYKLLTDT